MFNAVNDTDTPSQLSLVAFYRRKPVELVDLIRKCQEISSGELNASFSPYDIDQVHATLTGMERVTLRGIDDLYLNRNAHVLQDRRVDMRFEGLARTVGNHLPLTIRWGGYEETDKPYDGNSASPFRRSIYFNRSTGKLVLIGWPHQGGDFSEPRLLYLRNELENECGLVHKYRNDNDFFQVLGAFDTKLLRAIEGKLARAERLLSSLVDSLRLDVQLGPDDCRVVCYTDTTLPTETTDSITLASEDLSDDGLKRRYGNRST